MSYLQFMFRYFTFRFRDGAGELIENTRGIWHSYCKPEEGFTKHKLEQLCADLGITFKNPTILHAEKNHTGYDIESDEWSLIKLNEFVTYLVRNTDRPIVHKVKTDNCKTVYLDCNR